jgi:hypothetical protein
LWRIAQPLIPRHRFGDATAVLDAVDTRRDCLLDRRGAVRVRRHGQTRLARSMDEEFELGVGELSSHHVTARVLTPPEAITLTMSTECSARLATARTMAWSPDTTPPRNGSARREW